MSDNHAYQGGLDDLLVSVEALATVHNRNDTTRSDPPPDATGDTQPDGDGLNEPASRLRIAHHPRRTGRRPAPALRHLHEGRLLRRPPHPESRTTSSGGRADGAGPSPVPRSCLPPQP